MRWIKPSLRSSIYALLGNPAPPTESLLENGTEDIRQAMLDILGESGSKHFPQITRRVRYATDVQALWYLRGDLMAALSAMHGESAGRKEISKLNNMFHGLLPSSLTEQRKSRLAG